jgi:F-type H+-transporting ATPase subunit epsilon
MKAFALQLYDAAQEQRITGVTAFIGEDASGNFGIRANHARFMTTLVFGLARFRQDEEDWQYLALPGAVLYFNNNELTLSTRRFMVDTDLDRISALLEQQFIAEEEDLRATKTSLQKMEQAMLARLRALKWEML